MTKIDFDEPSRGNVNSTETAIEINQSGQGGAILAISKKSIGITVEDGTVFGEPGIAVYAVGHGNNATGIDARCDNGIAVKGTSLNQSGVYGKGKDAGVSGESDGIGVKGITRGKFGIGVHGEADNPEGGAGVVGVTKSWIGVHGISKEKGGHGVMGEVQHAEGGVKFPKLSNIEIIPSSSSSSFRNQRLVSSWKSKSSQLLSAFLSNQNSIYGLPFAFV